MLTMLRQHRSPCASTSSTHTVTDSDPIHPRARIASWVP
jgi:hypothetical protein